MNNLRVVFAGTPEFAARHLQGLLDAGTMPIACYTQPDRPAGRGKKLTPSPVKILAQANDIPVFQPPTLRDEEAQSHLQALAPDLLIVVAYGLILPQAVLDIPRFGCVNVHASLLPRWRGAAPIQRAIEAGDDDTGITIMQMEAGLDTGPMLAKSRIAIDADMNAGQLHDALAAAGVPLLNTVVASMPDVLARAEAQDDQQATYAAKIEKPEARLNWSLDAATLGRQVRAFNPFPVCWAELGDTRIKVWEAYPVRGAGTPGEILDASDHGLLVACGEGALLITVMQWPGSKAMPVADILRARRDLLAPGNSLSQH